MTLRPLALAALLVAAPALAGCAALGGGSCRDPYPLVLQAYPEVGNASNYEFHTVLWNCTDALIPFDEPCGGEHGLLPRLVVDDVEYRIAWTVNGTAVPANAVPCGGRSPGVFGGVGDGALAKGGWMESRHRWDGTYRPEDADAPIPVPDGDHIVSVEAGRHYASQVVTVPWPART